MQVGDEVHEARRAVVIAVGSGAVIPPIPGLEEIAPWTNRAATTAKAVPGRLTVLGGGAVGCEMSQAWRSLGAEVTLIESQPQLLTGEEPFASEQLAQSLREQGVDVRLGATATAAARDGEEFVLTLDDGEAIRSDELLVAVGRHPHTDGLGLDSVGLEPGRRSGSMTRCACRATTGCSRSGTSTAVPCSPTPASTRRGSPARRS